MSIVAKPIPQPHEARFDDMDSDLLRVLMLKAAVCQKDGPYSWYYEDRPEAVVRWVLREQYAINLDLNGCHYHAIAAYSTLVKEPRFETRFDVQEMREFVFSPTHWQYGGPGFAKHVFSNMEKPFTGNQMLQAHIRFVLSHLTVARIDWCSAELDYAAARLPRPPVRNGY